MKAFAIAALATAAAGNLVAETYYVSTKGKARGANGSKSAPYKDIQKAAEGAQPGDTICVAEGNYFGPQDSGTIKIKVAVNLQGGWSEDFSERDVNKHRTFIQPSAASSATSDNSGTLILDLDRSGSKGKTMTVDGFIIDRGYSNAYSTNKGIVDGVKGGLLSPASVPAQGGPNFESKIQTRESPAIKLDYSQANVVIKNCAFINIPDYAILGGLRANADATIENNVFVNVRMAVCEVYGTDNNRFSKVNFKNNTVLFVWSRKSDLVDMGYGFRMMTKTDTVVENNIFGCCVGTAVNRSRVDSTKAQEDKRIDALNGNVFFLNRGADFDYAVSPNIKKIHAAEIEEVDESLLEEVDGNQAMTDPAVFKGKINVAYLTGFMHLQSSTDIDMNSFTLFGDSLTKGAYKGSTTVSMFANRYPWEEALALFGAVGGKGAQAIK